MKKSLPCTFGSYWGLVLTPRPRYDAETGKYECPWCRRLLRVSNNLGVHCQVLPKHNKPSETK